MADNAGFNTRIIFSEHETLCASGGEHRLVNRSRISPGQRQRRQRRMQQRAEQRAEQRRIRNIGLLVRQLEALHNKGVQE